MGKDIFQLLRPQQWVKNGVVLAGLIFSGNAGHSDLAILALATTGLFCLLSSTVYIFNDIADIEADRNHPAKRNRPIASGRISKSTAMTIGIILGIIALAGLFLLSKGVFGIAAAYLLLNIFYSYFLKHVVIIDVMAIATGFVLRALAGAVVIHVQFSGWLLISTFLLALFLGFGKRRHELVLLDQDSKTHRKILEQYSPNLLDQLIAVVTPAVLICYLLYVISPEVEHKLGTPYLYLTAPFVIYGIFRYLYLIHQKEQGGSPTQVLLTDLPIIVTVILWLTTALLLLYVI